MTLLKLLFVILIILPIAFVMMFMIDNLSKDASDNTIDIDEMQEEKRRADKRKKRQEMIRSVGGTAKKTAQETARKTAKKTARKKKRRSAAGHPASQKAASRQYASSHSEPANVPVQDNSRAYIEEYKRRREELENKSRYSNSAKPAYQGRKPSLKGFDTLYGKRKK